ncbi:LPS export ABC transporter permease LptF [Frigidibacter sp. RF13]|uniref:LPS export ABC transporter permease LptF n=1 Tax=Frigidibacter sp. RF13 TaxID=2997340 RepID=UPI002D1E4401|nr:LPS export ABC transporter permease LptF [Frigidibacter sp. RF13]
MLSQLMMFFGFFALVLVSVYWVNRAVRLFDQLISDNQSVWVFLELSALSLPNVIRLMLPVAAFVATIYATNRLSSESELVVMQATGFSPFRLARPVIYFGLIVALMLSVLSHFLVPMSRARLNERNLEVSQNVSSKFLSEGTFVHPAKGITLFIGRIDQTGELGDFFLSDRRDPAAEVIYSSKRAYLARSDSGPKLVLLDGQAQRLDAATGRLSLTRFENFTYDITSFLTPPGERWPQVEELPTSTLLSADEAAMSAIGATVERAWFEAHDRIAKPFLPLALALVAFAALQGGSYSRFGHWRQIGQACGLFVVLFLISNLADKAAASRPGLLGLCYLAPAVGVALGAAMLAWAGRGRRPARAGREALA